MTDKRAGPHLGVLAFLGLAVCCGLSTLLAVVGGVGAALLRGWPQAGAILLGVTVAAVTVLRRLRTRDPQPKYAPGSGASSEPCDRLAPAPVSLGRTARSEKSRTGSRNV